MMNFYYGVVEDRVSDPLKLGRCKVRVVGLHTEDKTQLPTAELPWATILQPVYSAAVSGIGYSPLGPVEGTWVLVTFTDEYLQSPIIIGTLGGIPSPTEPVIVEERIPLTDSQGSVVTDSSGQPILTGETQQVDISDKKDDTQRTFKPSSLKLSAKGLSEIQLHEGLASSSPDRIRLIKSTAPASTPVYAYRDTRGILTIGWGSTLMPDGTPVTPTSVITKAQADEQLARRLATEFEPGVRRVVKVPITQSMYDACVSLVYNMGVSGFAGTKIASLLNSGDYRGASAAIPLTKTNSGTLTSRRLKEQALFNADGFPTLDGDIDAAPESTITAKEQKDATQNPVILKRDNGNQQIRQQIFRRQSDGFQDPNKVYPKWINEPDTHRLARGESIEKTIVFAKEAARVRSVKIAGGGVWSQPPIPYNAKYPFNHVFSTESGHVDEWDDTPNNERRSQWHKSGTYSEVDVNGTTVNRIVGDKFEILERNGNVVIRGNCNVTIEGNHNVRVENDANVQVLGNVNLQVTGSMKAGIGQDFLINCGGRFSVDASRVDLNSGFSSGVGIPSESASGVKEFGTLTTPSRTQALDSNYETPEEGSNNEFITKQVEKGVVEPEDVPAATPPVEEAAVETKKPNPISTDCDFDMSQLTSGYQLTTLFKLGKLFPGESGIPSGVNYGLRPEEIICNIKKLAVNCLEPILRRYPNMILTSTWRSEAVNRRVGGSNTSDHLRGFAADIQFTGFSRKDYYEAVQEIAKLLPAYRQLILEYKGNKTWIHISFNSNDNKMQNLTIDAATNTTIGRGKFVLIA